MNDSGTHKTPPQDIIDINLYLDDANKVLWETMNKSFNISVEYCSESSYGNNLKNKDCTIYIPKNSTPDKASFTHELLHLYLPFHGIYIGGDLECELKSNYPLNVIFNKDLYDHISNSLEHIKLLSVYLDMGYPIEKFLTDYYVNKLTDSEVNWICKWYRKGLLCHQYNSWAVNFFIGKFFAVKADINHNNNYSQQMIVLDKLDPTLYDILDKFWNRWVEYDIEQETALGKNSHDIVETFVNELIGWSKHKHIV